MAKQRRNFTREFKLEAVRRIAAEGKSLAEVARELGLGESLLRSWKTALADEGEQAFPGKGNLPAVEEELRRLRAENQRLRLEREILPLNASIARPQLSSDLLPEVHRVRSRA
jgi:transposase